MGIIKIYDVLFWLVCSWLEMCSCSSVRHCNAVLGRCLRSLSRNAVAYSAVHPAWWNFRWTLYRSLFLVFPRFGVCGRLRTHSSFWRNRVLQVGVRTFERKHSNWIGVLSRPETAVGAKSEVWRVLDNEWAVWRWTSSVLVVLDLLENSGRNEQFWCCVACMVFTMEPSTTPILSTSRLRMEYFR